MSSFQYDTEHFGELIHTTDDDTDKSHDGKIRIETKKTRNKHHKNKNHDDQNKKSTHTL